MILLQRPLRSIYQCDTLSLTNSNLITADTILWCTKPPFPIDDLHFISHSKNYNPLTGTTLSHLNSCTRSKFNLYLANSLAAAISEPALVQASNIPSTKSHVPLSLGRTKVLFQVRSFVCEYFVTKIRFDGEELLAPRPTPKLEDHRLSAVRHCLFNVFAATLPTHWRPFLYDF
jgi:hypothetical protein